MKELTVIDQNLGTEFSFFDNASGVILRDFEGFEYSSVREVIEDVAGPQSSIYVTSKFGRRRISWGGDLIDADVFSLRREMLAPLRQTGQLKLITFTTYDDLELQCEAEIVKVLMPYNHMIHTFLIEAVMPDWRFYSQEEKQYQSKTENQNIVNDGTEETSPVFRLKGPGTYFLVRNLSSSQEFTITAPLLSTDYIDVDVNARTVIKNGTTSLFSSFDGEFFPLVPGLNAIQFQCTGDSLETYLRTTFRDAYNGI